MHQVTRLIIIWIVKEFRNEHKAALDWLNEHTDEKLNFFGINIELWKIGESEIAPKFNVVCQPNSWSKTIKSTSNRGELSDTALMQMSFFDDLISFCKGNRSSLRLSKSQPSTPAYYSFGIGISGVWVAVKLNRYKKVIKLDIYFTEKSLFLKLREEIEVKVKDKFPNIIWDDMPKYKGATVGLELKNFVLENEASWDKHYLWIKDNAESLVEFFSVEINRVKRG